MPISIDIDCGWSSGSETVKLISSKLSSNIKSFSTVPIIFELHGRFDQWRQMGGRGDLKEKRRIRKMKKERRRKMRKEEKVCLKSPKPSG